MRGLWIALIALWCAQLWAPNAFAQSDEDRAAARELGKQGIELYQAGNYKEAEDRLTRAHKIVGLTTTGLWRARCLVALGRLVEASEAYLEVTRMTLPDDASDLHREAKNEAKSEHAALAGQIPYVTVKAAGTLPADVEVRIDDRLLPPALIGARRPIDPGKHELIATRGAWKHAESFEVAQGAALELTVPTPPEVPAPQPPDPEPVGPTTPSEGSSVMPLLGWIAVGVGVAVAGTGVVFGLLALDKQSTLDEDCDDDNNCPPPLHGVVDEFGTFRTVSAVTIIVGGVFVIGGATILLVDLSNDGDVALELAPTGAALSGRF